MLTRRTQIKDLALHSPPESVATDGPLDVTFYDGARVFYQIADYTQDALLERGPPGPAPPCIATRWSSL